MTERVLRVARFRLSAPGAVADAHLRDVVVPALTAYPQVALCFVGRRGTEPDAERIVVSVWEAADALPVAATAADPGGAIEARAHHDSLAIEALPLVVDVRAPEPAEPTVLRTFHGTVRPGELEVYAREAEAGAAADVTAGHGPIALLLAASPPDRFVTVSAWTDWRSVERATGGDIRNPFATKFSARLLAWTVDHYELVPAARTASRPESPADPHPLVTT